MWLFLKKVKGGDKLWKKGQLGSMWEGRANDNLKCTIL